jgi:crotonobetainyl-CoA:carnitine CoA-transferase CaiB-like acyl-CoA transferase
MAPRIVPHLGSGEPLSRSGGRDSVIAIYQVFDTEDLPMTLGLGNDAIWRRFWNAVGEPGFGDDPRFASNEARRAHRAEIVDMIASLLRTRTRGEWLDLFAEQRIPAGPINRVDEIVRDTELLDEEFFYAADTPAGPVPQVGLGIGFDGQTAVHRSSPPALGEHTDAVLQQLGMSAAAINALRHEGII